MNPMNPLLQCTEFAQRLSTILEAMQDMQTSGAECMRCTKTMLETGGETTFPREWITEAMAAEPNLVATLHRLRAQCERSVPAMREFADEMEKLSEPIKVMRRKLVTQSAV